MFRLDEAMAHKEIDDHQVAVDLELLCSADQLSHLLQGHALEALHLSILQSDEGINTAASTALAVAPSCMSVETGWMSMLPFPWVQEAAQAPVSSA